MGQLILRLKPPTKGGAFVLQQELGKAVASLSPNAKAAWEALTPRATQVGGRDVCLVLTPKANVTDDQVRAIGQIAKTFQGKFQVDAEMDGRDVGDAPRAAAPEAPATAYDLSHDPDETAPTLDADEPTEDGEDGEDEVPPYEEWSKADLVAECEARELPKSGTIAKLAARLEANDAEEPDDEE